MIGQTLKDELYRRAHELLLSSEVKKHTEDQKAQETYRAFKAEHETHNKQGNDIENWSDKGKGKKAGIQNILVNKVKEIARNKMRNQNGGKSATGRKLVSFLDMQTHEHSHGVTVELRGGLTQ